MQKAVLQHTAAVAVAAVEDGHEVVPGSERRLVFLKLLVITSTLQ